MNRTRDACRRRSLAVEALEQRLLLDAADFAVDVDWVYYGDGAGRSIAWDFSTGLVAADGSAQIPAEAILSRAAGEADSNFFLSLGGAKESGEISGGQYTLAIPQAQTVLQLIPRAAITVDGAVDDWTAVPIYCEDASGDTRENAPAGTDIQWVKVAYNADRSRLCFLIRFDAKVSVHAMYSLYLGMNWTSDKDEGGDALVDIYPVGDGWGFNAYGWSESGNFRTIASGGEAVSSGAYLEGSLSCAAFGLPKPLDVTFRSYVPSSIYYDFASVDLLATAGRVELEGELAAVADTWTYAARFSHFQNANTENLFYSVSLDNIMARWETPVTLPYVSLGWFTGAFEGQYYDHVLAISVGLQSHLTVGQDYGWHWDAEDGDGLILLGCNPATTVVDMKMAVTDAGRTVTFYYRLNSAASDASGSDWIVLGTHTLSASRNPPLMYGLGNAIPTVRASTKFDAAFLQMPPELTGTFGASTLGDRWVPGQKGTIPVVVYNDGWSKAAGSVTVRLLASSDTTPSADDLALGEITQSLNLAAGAAKAFSFGLTVPGNLAPTQYYLLAQVDSSNAVAESDENNLLVSAEPVQIVWQFGNVGAKKNVALTLLDGVVPVVFTLKGDGCGEAGWTPDGFDIVFTGTTAKSAATVATKTKGATPHIHDVTVAGALRSFMAKTALVSGDMTFSGAVAQVALGGLAGDQQAITIGPSANAKDAVALVLGRVQDLTVASATPIKALTAVDWSDPTDPADSITAPSLGTLRVTGDKKTGVRGDFAASITLTDAAAKKGLGALTVAGWLDGAIVRCAAPVGNVTVGGMRHSALFAAVAAEVAGLPDAAEDFANAATALASLTVRGLADAPGGYSFVDSRVAAPVIGKASFIGAQLDNGGDPFGIAAISLKSLILTQPDKTKYKYPATWLPDPDDLTVRLLA